MEGLAEKLEPKERGQPWDGGAVAVRLVSSLGPDRHKLSGTRSLQCHLGARWDRKVVWDQIVVMTPERLLGTESHLNKLE